jgi:hypothetical protein
MAKSANWPLMRAASRLVFSRTGFTGLALAMGLVFSAYLHAYNTQTSPLWPSGNVTLNIQLGPLTNGSLLDGSTSWADPIEAAINEWNQHLGLTQLRGVRDGNAPHARLNGVNTIVFSDSIQGAPWTGRTIAYSVYWWQNGRRTETDIMFKTPGVDWNSYRGSQRGITYDIRRFALHELGHSVGLDHPDDIGQNVTAIMNSTLGNPDALQPDDLAGIRLLYASNLPAITTQPTARTVAVGASVTFTVAAVGVPPPTYQWRRNGAVVPGATAASLTISNVTASDAGTYSVVVSNSAGSVTSANALLTVNSPPLIATQPTSRAVALGGSVTFTVTSPDVPPPTYQWRRNGATIPGATAASLTISNVTVADLATYSVVLSNAVGSTTSANAQLTLSTGPVIATHPVGRAVEPGGSVTLTVIASSSIPATYQWRRDDVAIAGATTATLTLGNLPIGNPSTYTVAISNAAGTTISDPAVVTVNWARLTNLSVRTGAGAGAQTLIAGFVVSGTGSKNVLVRAVGPTLSQFGVPGALANPRLDLFQAASLQLGNDNWGGSPALIEAFLRTGAFSLPAASLDAASTTTLAPTSYTMQVTGVGGITGVALAELYDTAPTSTTRFSNVSVRAHVDVGANLLIVGLSISGTVSKTVLLRAIGPTLTTFGVTGVLADPRLELFSSAAVKITENDNWGGTAALANAFSTVGAFALPAASRDAVLLVTLAPGSYTAQASGVSSTTGVALVEVYEVP